MLKIEKSLHGMDSFTVQNNRELARLIANIIGNSWSESEDYKVTRASRAFLQGYDYAREEWALVEFWTEDRQAINAFVAHVLKKWNWYLEMHPAESTKGY